MARYILSSLLCLGAALAVEEPVITFTGTAAAAAATQATVFLGGTVSEGFAASIISADPCHTTYQLQCTNSLSCNAAVDVKFTFTEGPSSWQFTYGTAVRGTSAQVTESCAISGSSKAICVATVSGNVGTSTVIVATTSVSTADYFVVPVTGGVALPTGTCSSADYSPAPTNGALAYTSLYTNGNGPVATSSGAATKTGAAAVQTADVYKVIVVPAMAAAAAAAALL